MFSLNKANKVFQGKKDCISSLRKDIWTGAYHIYFFQKSRY